MRVEREKGIRLWNFLSYSEYLEFIFSEMGNYWCFLYRIVIVMIILTIVWRIGER